MRRRAFLAGLLSTTAAVALPIPKTSTAVEAIRDLQRSFTVAAGSAARAAAQGRYLGVALGTAKAGEQVAIMTKGVLSLESAADLLINHTIYVTAREDTVIGHMVTDEQVVEWTYSSPEQVRQDVYRMVEQLGGMEETSQLPPEENDLLPPWERAIRMKP